MDLKKPVANKVNDAVRNALGEMVAHSVFEVYVEVRHETKGTEVNDAVGVEIMEVIDG